MIDPPGEVSLAAELSTLLADVDRVPPRLLASASAVLAWRDPDARLAVLVAEQARTEVGPPGVRGVPPRMLTFTVDDSTIDIGLSVEDGRVRLIGQISPMGAMSVEVRHRDGVWTGQTDALGRFSATDLPTGPMRVCYAPDGTHAPVCTEMFTA